MPGKYTSDGGKARILAWRQENVPMKVICERSGRGNATIMSILTVAKELPRNTVPKTISQFTDTIMKQELQKYPR